MGSLHSTSEEPWTKTTIRAKPEDREVRNSKPGGTEPKAAPASFVRLLSKSALLAGKPTRNPNQEALFNFCVVNKRIKTRFFDRRQNPKLGTVVGNVIILLERTDFYNGSARERFRPLRIHNIIYDTCGLEIDHLQMLAYKQ